MHDKQPMVLERIKEVATNLAHVLEISGASSTINRFLDCLQVDESGNSTTRSIVSTIGLPFEFSFSGKDDQPAIRLLVELTEPGDTMVNRCFRAIEGAAALADTFRVGGGEETLSSIVSDLLPTGEYMARLQWAAATWFAIRVDSHSTAFRIYVNLQWRQWGHRYQRIKDFLERTGEYESSRTVNRIATLFSGWGMPVGVSLSALPENGIKLARIHFNPGKLPIQRLADLLLYAGVPQSVREVIDFFDIFQLIDTKFAANALLISVGLRNGEISSVKFDVHLFPLTITGRAARDVWCRAEALFGEVRNYTRVKNIFEQDDSKSRIQYIGLTLGRQTSPYLNIYLSPPKIVEDARCLENDSMRTVSHLSAIASGLAFIKFQQSADGTFPADMRSKLDADQRVSPGSSAIYLSSVICRELTISRKALAEHTSLQFSDYTAPSGTIASYESLADCPFGTSVLAMICTCHMQSGRRLPERILDRLLGALAPNGGFRETTADSDEQPDIATTLHTVNALSASTVVWDYRSTADYLRGWLRGQVSLERTRSYSELYPLYLLSMSEVVNKWLGESVPNFISERLSTLRREDGCWGAAGPEALDTSLAVLCQARLGTPITRNLEVAQALMACQLADGGWCWSPLISDGAGTWVGSRALTTTVAVCAIEYAVNLESVAWAKTGRTGRVSC